jgi:hypothetical protein
MSGRQENLGNRIGLPRVRWNLVGEEPIDRVSAAAV